MIHSDTNYDPTPFPSVSILSICLFFLVFLSIVEMEIDLMIVDGMTMGGNSELLLKNSVSLVCLTLHHGELEVLVLIGSSEHPITFCSPPEVLLYRMDSPILLGTLVYAMNSPVGFLLLCVCMCRTVMALVMKSCLEYFSCCPM